MCKTVYMYMVATNSPILVALSGGPLLGEPVESEEGHDTQDDEEGGEADGADPQMIPIEVESLDDLLPLRIRAHPIHELALVKEKKLSS